jgi:hypothetical protein
MPYNSKNLSVNPHRWYSAKRITGYATPLQSYVTPSRLYTVHTQNFRVIEKLFTADHIRSPLMRTVDKVLLVTTFVCCRVTLCATCHFLVTVISEYVQYPIRDIDDWFQLLSNQHSPAPNSNRCLAGQQNICPGQY